ncbi:MAG: hypothetical protein AMXMBFR4_09670 [Candidatus Hydrogenedentota bacterium]
MERFKQEARETMGDPLIQRLYDLHDECLELAESCKRNEEEFGVAALECIAYRVASEILARQHELAPEKYPDAQGRIRQINEAAAKRRKQPTEP